MENRRLPAHPAILHCHLSPQGLFLMGCGWDVKAATLRESNKDVAFDVKRPYDDAATPLARAAFYSIVSTLFSRLC